MAKPSPNVPCLCGSGRKYKKCCRVFHQGTPAPSPDLLMKSRYVAYAFGLSDYIIKTTDPGGPHWQLKRDAWRAELDGFTAMTTFLGVEILSSKPGVDDATVTFRARLEQHGADATFTEESRFVPIDGRWLYHGAVTLL